MFFLNLVTVLRGCCLHCYTILCSHAEKSLFSMQMLYLKHGEFGQIDALQSIDKKWIVEKKSLQVFDEEMNEHISQHPMAKKGGVCTTKNLLAIRQQLIKDFERRALKAKRHFSPKCNTPLRTLRADFHAKLFYSQGVSNKQLKVYQQRLSNARQAKKFDDNDDDDDDEEAIENTEEFLVKMLTSQISLTPLDVLKHFELIWKNEKEVLSISLATRRSPQHWSTNIQNNLINLFFFEVLPSKFRPVLSFNDQKFENPKTMRYPSIIQDKQLIKELLSLKDKQAAGGHHRAIVVDQHVARTDERREAEQSLPEDADHRQFHLRHFTGQSKCRTSGQRHWTGDREEGRSLPDANDG